jgi:very-short-patch-repair endonuclease
MQRPAVYRARQLRRTISRPERLLWAELRGQPLGLKFRRQHPVGPYVVDFCCLQKQLVVEVDGMAHDMGDNPVRDEERERFLRENGFRVLRVSAQRVLADAAGTAAAILASAHIPLHHAPHGPRPRAGEEH